MNFLFKYSGLFVVLFSWLFVVIPYFSLRKKKKFESLSDIGAMPKYSIYFNAGIIVVAILHMLFIAYVAFRVPTTDALKSVLILYYSSFHLFLMGIIHRGFDRNLHDLLSKIYFTTALGGAYFLSASFHSFHSATSDLLKFIILLSIFGALLLYFTAKWLFAEVWTIFFSSVWMITIYVYIL